MMTPFDTSLMHHKAEKYRLPTEEERVARAEAKRRARAAFRAFVAQVFEFAPRHGTVIPKAQATIR